MSRRQRLDPSTLSVAYATNAGNATTATNATNAAQIGGRDASTVPYCLNPGASYFSGVTTIDTFIAKLLSYGAFGYPFWTVNTPMGWSGAYIPTTYGNISLDGATIEVFTYNYNSNNYKIVIHTCGLSSDGTRNFVTYKTFVYNASDSSHKAFRMVTNT